MKTYIYDIEIYPNLFLIVFKEPNVNIYYQFEISQYKDNRKELHTFIHIIKAMVGFNNLTYDYPILDYYFTNLKHKKGSIVTNSLFNYSKKLIKGNVFIRQNNHKIKQIDLFKINHYDNKARITSLKMLEFNMRLPKIQELPYEFNKLLTEDEIIEIREYCNNDVLATEKFYHKSLAEIELREKISKIYKVDFTNYNSVKIGETILINHIIKKLGENKVYDYRETTYGEKRYVVNTIRSEISLSLVVFSYISFNTKPFQQLLLWFKSKIINELKGVFSNIPIDELNIIEGYYNKTKQVWNPRKNTFDTRSAINTKNQLKTLNINNFDFQFDFGVGGLHGSLISGIYSQDDDYIITDLDFASYYPNLAIHNKFYPEHLGIEFCDIYEDIYNTRKKYPKGTAENFVYKLALNGAYGKSNSQYSPLCDSAYTLKTTVNGQLLLCKLIENVMLRIPNCSIIQVNTDGVTFKYPRIYKGLLEVVSKDFEKYSNLELEAVDYDKMIILNVNNYIAITTDNYIKRKGATFIYKEKPGELELHKNFSQLIVPKLLESYFVHNTDINTEILSANTYDFFKRTKIRKSDKLLMRTIDNQLRVLKEEELQRITRYVITGEIIKEKDNITIIGQGYQFIKQMPALPKNVTIYMEKHKCSKQEAEQQCIRHNSIEAGYLCTPFNIIDNIDDVKKIIYYPYYLNEINKIIKQIEYAPTKED